MRILAATVIAAVLVVGGGIAGYAVREATTASSAARPPSTTPRRHHHHARPPTTRANAFGLVSVPTVRCPTQLGIPSLAVPLPATTRAPVPPSDAPLLAAYRDRLGHTVLGPRRWLCRSEIGADGTLLIALHPRGTPPPRGSHVRSPGDGVTLQNGSACQSCIYAMVCSLQPTAPVVRAYQSSFPCPAKPLSEQTARLSSNSTLFYDPRGVVGQGDPSGGADPALGVLISTDFGREAQAAQATCTLPAAEAALCQAIIQTILANQAAP